MINAPKLLAPAALILAAGLAACGPTHTSAAHAKVKQETTVIVSNPQTRHAVLIALQDLQVCSARQGVQFNVAQDSKGMPVVRVTGYKASAAFHPVRHLEAAFACAVPPRARKAAKSCVKKIKLHRPFVANAVEQTAQCIVGAPQ